MFKEVREDWPFEVNLEGTIIRNKETKRVYKQILTWDGYYHVRTTYKTKSISQRVHRIVAMAFIPNPENKPQINHMDGNKLNNHVNNLEWCTCSENQLHAVSLGIKNTVYGEQNGSSVLTEVIVHEVCRMIQEGYRNKDIADKLGINRSQVKDIRLGKAWKRVASQYQMQFIRRGRISENTVHWICLKMQDGYTNTEIKRMCTNPNVSYSQIKHIRSRNSYHDITSKYKY